MKRRIDAGGLDVAEFRRHFDFAPLDRDELVAKVIEYMEPNHIREAALELADAMEKFETAMRGIGYEHG